MLYRSAVKPKVIIVGTLRTHKWNLKDVVLPLSSPPPSALFHFSSPATMRRTVKINQLAKRAVPEVVASEEELYTRLTALDDHEIKST